MQTGARRSTNVLVQIVIGLLAAIIAYFLTVKSLETIARVPWASITIHPWLAVLSLFLLTVGYLLLAFNWREVVLSLGNNLSLSNGLVAWTVSQFGKYIPGTIWFAVGRAYLAKQNGVSTFATSVSTAIESILMSIAALSLGLLAVTTQAAEVTGMALYVLLALLGLTMLQPRILSWLVRFAARRLHVRQPVTLRYKELYFLFVNYAIAWLVIGVSFYLLVQSLGLTLALPAAGCFVLAWAVGFLAVFVPGGLGVREAVLVLLLTPALGEPQAFLVALVSRLWWIAGESLATLVSLALRRVKRALKTAKVQNIAGNFFNKYGTKNPVERWLVNQYFNGLYKFISQSDARTLLDVGCGEGLVDCKLLKWFPQLKVQGLDLERVVIEKACQNNPGVTYCVGSVLELPFPKNSFDVVLCGEVLEHLYEPERAVRELRRVAERVIITVPHEPFWRIGNMARGKYWRALGNTPGHVQNFSPKELRNLLSRYFTHVEIRQVGMWTVAHCWGEQCDGRDQLESF
ncbi:MAG: methyltransferase domain-containing protein [Parcubacteria group bacterium]